MIGIKETKELVKFIVRLAEALDKSMVDKKIDFMDAGNLISALMASVEAFNGINEVPKELGDLDEFEIQDLYAYAKTELQLSHENTEEIVEAAVNIGLQLLHFRNLLAKKGASAPAA